MFCYKNIVDIIFFFKFLPKFRQPQFFSSLIFGNDIAAIFFPSRISTMALLQLVSFLSTSHFEHTAHTRTAGSGSRNFGNHITEIQNFFSPTFFFSLSLILLLNFVNTIAKIHSLSSFP